jgi:ATP adenylyltransferase
MRYIKVLLLIVLIFLTLVFFSQNHSALSQNIVLTLNLLFIPPVSSSPLPFYYIVAAAFFLGALFALAILIWDKLNLSAKLMKNKWRISNLEREVEKLKKSCKESPGNTFLQNVKNRLPDDVTSPDPDKP